MVIKLACLGAGIVIGSIVTVVVVCVAARRAVRLPW